MNKKFAKEGELSSAACAIIAGNAQSGSFPGGIDDLETQLGPVPPAKNFTDGPGREAMGERVDRVAAR